MKIALIAATFLISGLIPALAPALAYAAPAQRVDARQFYTCAGKSLSRVSMATAPTPCCDGMLGCPQLLSNTGLVKQKRDSRT